jgi:hypothetical protein
LKDNPEISEQQYNKIFGIKKEQPSYKQTEANKKKFLVDNPKMTVNDFNALFKNKIKARAINKKNKATTKTN